MSAKQFVAILSNQGRLHKEAGGWGYFEMIADPHVAILSNQGRLHKVAELKTLDNQDADVAILSNQGRLHKVIQ